MKKCFLAVLFGLSSISIAACGNKEMEEVAPVIIESQGIELYQAETFDREIKRADLICHIDDKTYYEGIRGQVDSIYVQGKELHIMTNGKWRIMNSGFELLQDVFVSNINLPKDIIESRVQKVDRKGDTYIWHAAAIEADKITILDSAQNITATILADYKTDKLIRFNWPDLNNEASDLRWNNYEIVILHCKDGEYSYSKCTPTLRDGYVNYPHLDAMRLEVGAS